MTITRTFKHSLMAVVLAFVAGASGCASESADNVGPDKNDDRNEAPTEGLRVLAGVAEQSTIQTLFEASIQDEDVLSSRLATAAAASEAGAVSLHADGLPLHVGLDIGQFWTGLAGVVWTGRSFELATASSGGFALKLENPILGGDLVNASVTVDTLQNVMATHDETVSEGGIPVLGANDSVSASAGVSVVIDYTFSGAFVFSSLIEEIRPVSAAAFERAGLTATAGATENLWVGRATVVVGDAFTGSERVLVTYFALDFGAAAGVRL